MKVQRQMSESIITIILFTLSGGMQDAYSYITRNHVFANAQTGNIVLFGTNLAKGNFSSSFIYLIQVLAFILGVYASSRIEMKFKELNIIHWRQIIVLIQIVVLVIVSFLGKEYNVVANLLMSFSCAMQVNMIRKYNGISCATTMCIGNMRTATDLLGRYHHTKDSKYFRQSLGHYMIIVIFAVGAVLGSITIPYMGYKTILLSALFLLIAFILMFHKEENIKY